MSRFPQLSFEVNWRPFELNPHEKGGTPKMEALNKKYGAQRVAAFLPHINKAFANLGIPFSYGGVTV
eukprot:CAMPEP_0181344426 /NCGR_PEP_ID=MMETSP1101-20121128/32166_1 /TAXON_ID=46948 /ORGANISM="Rhodomonas abbreviata, Strain Caron Lab Isolate" /LENGTH=66 /DNA_ID=CAMNT_0023456227 /DNA_START=105 /DNA_END=301 /DNA_ORIENTATION=+